VIHTIADQPDGLDINAQICFPRQFGRSSPVRTPARPPATSRHQGIFQLEGQKVGDFKATEVAKLVPTCKTLRQRRELRLRLLGRRSHRHHRCRQPGDG
jgi:hypothetical protein